MSVIRQTSIARRVHFVTLGCPKNEVDSDRMRGAIAAPGYLVTDDIAEADVVVLNTCGFIQEAVEESIAEALDLAEWRDEQPGRRLIVAGCMVSRYRHELPGALSEADAFIPVSGEDGLVTLLDDLFGCAPSDAEPGAQTPRRSSPTGPSAYLMVSDGCHRRCTYCTIPAIRGPYRSRTLDQIESEARFLVEHGAREIVLIGQDISSWGRDLAGAETLADVITTVAAIPDLAWLRLMYMQPDGVNDHLLAVMASTPKVCRYLDMPLQHVSVPVLRGMHRSGSAETYLELISSIRSVMPDVVLRTTFIAGFPGETPASFRELTSFIERARLDYVGVFPYSPEAGTIAAELPNQLSRRTRIARAQKIRDSADSLSTEYLERLIGTTLEVLVEGVDEDGGTVGRWRGQAPDIDGLVLLDRPMPAGEMITAFVTGTIGYDLEAEVR